ncbi:MAG: TraC family protein [Oligoflexales bacterium]
MTKTLSKPIRNSLSDKSGIADLFERSESLSALLPYDDYVPAHQVFQMKDGSLGAVFEVELLEHEHMTERQIIRAVESIKNWFSLRENCVLQILFESSQYSPFDNKISELGSEFRNQHPVSKLLYSEKLQAIKEGCNDEQHNGPLKRTLLVSVRYFLQRESKAKLRDLADPKALLERSVRALKSELDSFKHMVKEFKENSEVSIKKLDDEALVGYLRKFFNPKSNFKRKFAPLNRSAPISEQLLFSSPMLDFSGIECEGVKSRVLTLKTSPSFSYPGGMAYFVNLAFPFRIAINISFPSPQSVKKFLGAKEFFLENAATAKARVQKEEINYVQEQLARDDRVLHMTFCIIVDGESDEILEERTRKISHIFHNQLECEVIEETDIGLGLWINCLPLAYTPESDFSTRRAIRILRSDCKNFVPLFDSFRGFNQAIGLYLSRENNIVPFSLLENETSNHTVVLADTGSGKSAFIVDWLQSLKKLDPEPIVFVIDKKSSYGMLSKYFDGDLTVFKRDQQIPFSPFRGIYNEEKIAFLTKMISMALKLTSPSFQVESEHHTLITKALKQAYLKKYDRHGLDFVDGEFIKQKSDKPVAIDMNDFVVELGSLVHGKNEREKGIIETLVSKLKPFYGDGTYAPFFTFGKPDSLDKNTLFYVYDLDALDNDPTLQTLMTMAVIEEIRCILSLPQNQGRQGVLVMEEFAMLGRNNKAFRDFAIDFAETMRKRGCWLITLTPRPQNYFDLEVGKAFWGVADNFIFLQMSSDNVDYIAEKSSLLDEANKEIIRSLRTKKGKYADIYYMNKSKTKQGAFRYRQTKYDRWMAPSNALDTMEVVDAFDKFPNRWEALEFLVGKN